MKPKYIAMLDAKSRGHLLGGWVLREVVRQIPTETTLVGHYEPFRRQINEQ